MKRRMGKAYAKAYKEAYEKGVRKRRMEKVYEIHIMRIKSLL